MIQPSTISFLEKLKKNNNKPWFDENRVAYETAKEDFEKFVASVLGKLGMIDQSVADLKPRDCTFRINRDIRFSKDKTPYKTNFAMYIAKGGKKTRYGGYYFHCEPGGAFLAGGIWMPMAPELKKLRQEIDYNWKEFRAIVSGKKFSQTFVDLEKTGETSLVRPPKGYEEENPAIEYLKLKSFIATTQVPDPALTSKDLEKKLLDHFKTIKPLVDFLNRGIE